MSELKPETWLFQHEETGVIHYVDSFQIENGFEKNNPRLQKIAPMYRIPEGYALVPIEPTEAMVIEACKHYESIDFTGPTTMYKAMLKAAQGDE